MEHCSRKPGDENEIPAFGPDSIEMAMRWRIRDTIEEPVKQQLEAALGAVKSAQVGDTRQGYRHGTRERTLTTSLGPTTIAMPRARVHRADGANTEWHSETVRRYQRRTTWVDEAILGVYHAAHQRRVGAVAARAPAVEGCVSRLVSRLREDFEAWRARDLADEDIRYVFLDGWSAEGQIDAQAAGSLRAKLNDAKQALDRGNLTAARNKLHDFIDQVSDRREVPLLRTQPISCSPTLSTCSTRCSVPARRDRGTSDAGMVQSPRSLRLLLEASQVDRVRCENDESTL